MYYEHFGLSIRHRIGVGNLMWESDYPHVASTYPRSWEFLQPRIASLPEADRRQILYENALRVYRLDASVRLDVVPGQGSPEPP